jgi:transposase
MKKYMDLLEYRLLLEWIPFGKEKAISRKELVAKMGASDRIVRRMIARLRKETTILTGDSGGYYRPTSKDADQIERYIRRERKRAVSIFADVTYAAKYLDDLKCGRIQEE